MFRFPNSLRAVILGLCLAAPAFAPVSLHAQPAGESNNSAEVAFWNTVKDSKTAAEFEAYLQAFPNGLFAPLARLRIQQINSGATTEPPPPRQAPQQQTQPARPLVPPQQSPPVEQSNIPIDNTNRQMVSEIQSKLFNLNYSVKRFDGVFDTSTREAIRQWQERINVPVDGQMTEALLQRLRNSKSPAVWGAVAYTASGTIGTTWNRASRQEAEEVAIAECRRRGGRRASCDTLSAGDSACLALATYRAQTGGTVYYGARVALQPDLARAISNALQQCQEADRSRGTCVNKIAFCADGSHQSRR